MPADLYTAPNHTGGVSQARDFVVEGRTTRLFSILILIHIALVVASLLGLNFIFVQSTGTGIYADRNFWVVAGGLVWKVAAYVLLKIGRLKAGVLMYLASSAILPLTAPFVPDPDAAISLLSAAAIPVLLASVLFSARTTLLILLLEVAVAGVQLATTNVLTPEERNTGIGLVAVVAVTGGLIVVVTRHLRLVEAERLQHIRDGHEALLRSERERRSNEERYRGLFETITDGIFVCDATGRLVEVNQAACRQLGYSRDELLQLSIADIVPSPYRGVRFVMDAARAAGTTFVETRHRHKNGSIIPIELAVAAIDLQGAQGFLGVARDITERLRGEAEKGRLVEQLHHAMKMESIGRLAGGIAHDFNNLLTVIVGNTELALRAAATLPELCEPLQDVHSAGQSAATLTRQLLAFSRRQVLEPQPVDLNALVERTQNMLGRLIGEDVTVTLVAGETLGLVTADPSVLEQVIINLVVNARDAMPHGGRLIIETRNVVFGAHDLPLESGLSVGAHVMLSVSDTGTGIAPDVMLRLFEPFFTTKPKGKGTGLGLAMVWGVVKQSGGHVEVESELGKGSTFRVYLPRSGEARPHADVPIATTATRATGETILLVEDEDLVRATVARQLEGLGYRVLEAADASAALTHARDAAAIDLLLTDIVMPEIDGQTLASSYLALHPSSRVMFMSGYTDDGVVARYRELDPIVDLLTKPFSVDELAIRVRTALARGPSAAVVGLPTDMS